MCAGIALAASELSDSLVAHHKLERRRHERGGEAEYRFHYRDRVPLLPVWYAGQLRIMRWGNRGGKSQGLPRTGWTWQETVANGGWQGVELYPVDILATVGYEGGFWYRVPQGIQGIVAIDAQGEPVVYMLCQPATHYYQVMTRSKREPVFTGPQI